MDENGSGEGRAIADIVIGNPLNPPEKPVVVKPILTELTAADVSEPSPKPTNGNGVKIADTETSPVEGIEPIVRSKRRLSKDDDEETGEVRKNPKLDSSDAAPSGLNVDEEEEDELLKEITKITEEEKVVGDLPNGVSNGKELDEQLKEDDLLKRLSEIETPTRPKSSVTLDGPSDTDDLIERLEASAGDEEISVQLKKPEEVQLEQTTPVKSEASQQIEEKQPAVDPSTKESDLDEEDESALLVDSAEVVEDTVEEISAEIENVSHEADVLLATEPDNKDEPQTIEETLQAMEASAAEPVSDTNHSAQKDSEKEVVTKTETIAEVLDTKDSVDAEAVEDLATLLEDDENDENLEAEVMKVDKPTQSDDSAEKDATKSSNRSFETSPMPPLAVSVDTSLIDLAEEVTEKKALEEPVCTSSTTFVVTEPEKVVIAPEVETAVRRIGADDDTQPMDVDDELPSVAASVDTSVEPVVAEKTFDECSSTTNSEDAIKTTPKVSDVLLKDKLKAHLDQIGESGGSAMSTPNSTNVSTSNPSVFNSTPIVPKQKPFVMSTENVSKINETSEIEEVDGKKVESRVVVAAVSSNTDKKATKTGEVSETESVKATESDTKTIDTLVKCTSSSSTSSGTCSRFLDTCRQININGIDSTMDDSGEENRNASVADISGSSSLPNLSQLQLKGKMDLKNGLDTTVETNAVSSNDTMSTVSAERSEPAYEVSVYYEDQMIKTLSIERIDTHAIYSLSGSEYGSSRNYSSSNGSVSSLGPFSLPTPHNSNVSSTNSSSTISSDNHFAVPSLPNRMKHVVKGTQALYDYMIEYFTKCRSTLEDSGDELSGGSSVSTIKLSEVTPKKRKSVEIVTPTEKSRRGSEVKSATKKRSLSPKSEGDDEEKSKAKQSKKSPTPAKSQPGTPSIAVVPDDLDPEDLEKIGQCCLARWTDRKYYAGRIEQIRPSDKKIVVQFEDGATKALNPDLVIVGREDFLPLMDHSVHALTSGETYEPGLVTNMMRDNDDQVLYTVLMGSGEAMVPPSNMYLTDEQAKLIQVAQKKALAESKGETGDCTSMASPAAGKRVGRRNSKTDVVDLTLPAETGAKGRSLRNRRAADKTVNESPEAGYSGGVQTESKRGRRSNKRAIQPSRSESSDISETFDDSAPNSPDSGLEAIDGVQPELQKVPKESELIKMNVIAEYLGNDKNKSLDDILGPIPSSKTLFRNKHFILTCTIPIKGSKETSPNSEEVPKEPEDSMTNRLKKFATSPFVKEHLKHQIEAGGGKVYQHFEDIPKTKYKQCKLIAPHPCVTAKFVQCLAVDIQAVSHEWIIECCQKLTVLDVKPYLLPSGWSILENRYIKWAVGRGTEQRSCANPFFNNNVLLASQNKEFTEFWSRVCRFAGATIRFIKSESDITANLTGYMLTDQEFPDEIKLEAQRKGIPVVSSVWAVQSLILGKICQPNAHEKLTQIYQDDDF